MGLKLKHVFIANTPITVLFGLAFIFLSDYILPTLGINADYSVGFRFFGAFQVCHGILVFFARNSDDNPARKAILLFETIGGVVLVIFICLYMDLRLFSPWGSIVIQLVFSGLYAYFLFKKE
jgi:hypothetical protein